MGNKIIRELTAAVLLSALAALCLFVMTACSSEKDLYGTWYNDFNGTRNAVQFYKNKDGKNEFIWAVYDIENDEITSNTAGYYYVNGDSIELKSSDGSDSFDLTYTLDGNTLSVSSDTVSLKLTKYVSDDK